MLRVDVDGTKMEIKWFVKLLRRLPFVGVEIVSDMTEKKPFSMEDYLRADRIKVFYRMKLKIFRERKGVKRWQKE